MRGLRNRKVQENIVGDQTMKMQTGMAETVDTTINQVALQKLLLCFVAVYERQVLSKTFTYMHHNGCEDEDAFNDTLKRSLKFSTLSPIGIAAVLRPYLSHAYAEGVLLESDCDNNAFALKALSLFPQVHTQWERGGQAGARQWVMQYVFEMLSSTQAVMDEAIMAGDVDPPAADGEGANGADEEMEVDDDEEEWDSEEVEECICDLCEEMRAYDEVDLDSIQPEPGSLDAIIINGMKRALLL